MSFPAAPVDRLGPLGELGEGARIQIEGEEHAVAGWIAYDDEWVEYLLSDGSWLCVELVDGALTMSRWWDQIDGTPISGSEGEVAGVRYRRLEAYTARWMAAGIGDLRGPGQVRVVEYAGIDDPGLLAAVEDWGDGPELSLGCRVATDAVRLVQ